ncbi:Ribosomal RNA small subunit methyltransferase A [Bienertia sinuspersici]
MSISSIYSPPAWRNCYHPTPKITSAATFLYGRSKTINQALQFNSSIAKTCFIQQFKFPLRAKLEFLARAENGGEPKMNRNSKLEELRGQSTMPDRFKYLTKEAPSPPLRWPWLIGFFLSHFLFFLILYAVSLSPPLYFVGYLILDGYGYRELLMLCCV